MQRYVCLSIYNLPPVTFSTGTGVAVKYVPPILCSCLGTKCPSITCQCGHELLYFIHKLLLITYWLNVIRLHEMDHNVMFTFLFTTDKLRLLLASDNIKEVPDC